MKHLFQFLKRFDSRVDIEMDDELRKSFCFNSSKGSIQGEIFQLISDKGLRFNSSKGSIQGLTPPSRFRRALSFQFLKRFDSRSIEISQKLHLCSLFQFLKRFDSRIEISQKLHLCSLFQFLKRFDSRFNRCCR